MLFRSNSRAENVSAVELTRMVNEWFHPIGTDEKLTYRIWELIRGKTANKKKPVRSEEAASAQTVESHKRFPSKLPSGTKWEDFIVTFLDDESVYITVRGIKHKATFKDMGFEDKRSARPNSQWGLLRILAKYGGELNWNTAEADVKFKKCKERLTEQLKNYFPLEYDPFYPYQDVNSYKIKLTLVLPQSNETAKLIPKAPSSEEIHQEIEELFSGLVVEG